MEKIISIVLILCLTGIFASTIKCFVDSNSKLDFLIRRSYCDSCGKRLKIIELIPIISFIKQRGRCSGCRSKINRDVFYYEVLAYLIVIIYLVFDKYFLFINFYEVAILILLSYLAIEDIKTLELNNRLSLLLLIICLLKIILQGNFSIFSFLILVGIYHIVYLIVHHGLGYGDIKLFCLLALVFNIYEGIYLLIFTFFYAGLWAILLLMLKKVTTKSKIALIPFITLSYITIILIREIMLW